jgi:cysteine-rich repeat protein
VSVCGDGKWNRSFGEECDGLNDGKTVGDTAKCNKNCTLAKCGDVYTNVAAGEACDVGGESKACDSDCTKPECGDGHWNRVLEECDDGNKIETDGCKSDCTTP